MTNPAVTVAADFTDLISWKNCSLAIDAETGNCKGVSHPGCPVLADLVIELDAFFCPACKMNGRVTGAWAADVIARARAAVAENTGDDGD